MKPLLLLFITSLLLTTCTKDKKSILIEGFQLTDGLGNSMGTIGDASDDWKLIEWSQLSSKEQSFLNFTDNIDLNSTSVATLNNPVAFPNPFANESRIVFFANDSVKVKIAIVDQAGEVFKTYAFKMKGSGIIAFDFSDASKFPSGKSLRYYYSFSATAQSNFKVGYGDVKICRTGSQMDCF